MINEIGTNECGGHPIGEWPILPLSINGKH